MTLSEFIENNQVEHTENLINSENIKILENTIGVPFGKELSNYVKIYGYLAYKHVELYGINSKQMQGSDMVKQTVYLHTYFPKTNGFIALENTGDGIYIIVSSIDEIFKYSSEEDRLTPTNLRLFDYILKRFQECDE